MPKRSLFGIELTRVEREELESRVRKYTSPYCDVVPAKIVLLAAEGLSNDVIASRLDTPRQIVSKWAETVLSGALARTRRAASRRA